VPVPRRSTKWIWVGRVIALCCVAAVVAYLVIVGLDDADKISSAGGFVVALLALVAPYLLPLPSSSDSPPSAGSPAEPPSDNRIDLRHAQGVQINQSGGNTQTNNVGNSA